MTLAVLPCYQKTPPCLAAVLAVPVFLRVNSPLCLLCTTSPNWAPVACMAGYYAIAPGFRVPGRVARARLLAAYSPAVSCSYSQPSVPTTRLQPHPACMLLTPRHIPTSFLSRPLHPLCFTAALPTTSTACLCGLGGASRLLALAARMDARRHSFYAPCSDAFLCHYQPAQ